MAETLRLRQEAAAKSAARSSGRRGGEAGSDRPGAMGMETFDSLAVEMRRGITVRAVAKSSWYPTSGDRTVLYPGLAAGGVSEEASSTPVDVTLDPTDPTLSYLLTLIDCPGHDDFSGQVLASLRSMSGALLAIDAAQGPASGTAKGARWLNDAGIPFMRVLTKCDMVDGDDAVSAVAGVVEGRRNLGSVRLEAAVHERLAVLDRLLSGSPGRSLDPQVADRLLAEAETLASLPAGGPILTVAARKEGSGVGELLDAIVRYLPPPTIPPPPPFPPPAPPLAPPSLSLMRQVHHQGNSSFEYFDQWLSVIPSPDPPLPPTLTRRGYGPSTSPWSRDSWTFPPHLQVRLSWHLSRHHYRW
jgi:hypothetical protein